MFNGQNPPGGGGNPPQQPPNNPNLQLLAPQLQEALAAITNPQNQAQLLGLLLGLPQQQRQQPQPQQLQHEQLQQIVRLQQQQQQELLLQQEQRNQQQQQLQQQQIQQQQQQLQQILALQQQQELLRRLGAVAQNQQLNPLLAQQIAQQHAVNIPAPPATPIVPPAPLSAQPSAQPSPAQRVHVVNSPGILQASNQVMNFINQEENRVQQPQQPPAPPLVQPQAQRPQIATHSNVQIPVVRVQNNSAQVVAPQVHRPQPPPQPRPRHQPQNLPHHQVQHQPQPQPQRQPQPQSLHQPLPPPQRQPQPPPQHQPQPQPLHRPQPQPQHQFQPHPPQEPLQQRHQQLHQQPRQQPHQQLIQIRPAPPPPPQQVHPLQQLHVQQQQVEVPREPERLPSPPPPPPPRAPPVRARRGRGRGQRRQVEPDNGPPRVDEALSYLRIIKETFVNRVPVYHRFLDIMKNFRAQRIETSEVVEQVAALLYDSPNLVLGFNTFLPTGYKIAMLDGTKYTFTTPDNQTRQILLSPQERRQQRMDVGDPEEDELPLPPLEDLADEMDEMQDGNPSDESNEAGVEEEEEQIELPLMEEVIVDRGQAEEPEEEVDEVPEDMSAQTLEIVRLVTEAFSARPDRITSFLTFMDMYLSTTKFYIQKKKGGQKMDGGDARDEEMPGPAPPPQQAGPDENMEMEEDEEARRRGEAASKDEEALENAHQEHLISHLAEVCLGEPVLLATLIDFLPYLNTLLKNGSEQTAEKIQSILRFKVADNCGIAELADRERVDQKLLKKMESAKMGTKKEEKLVLTKIDESGEGSEEQLMVLQKTYRILYEKLKERTTATQIKHLITLLNMYLKMDLTKEQLVLQLPKVMGGSGTQAEIIILRLLGIDKDEKPENDPDAVTRKDLPPVQPKRGLRDQKQLQHTRTVEAATVCTLGPSYRLMKDSKEAACSGRVELEPEIKETLNDKWTSYPSWSSEETGNQPIKKSNLEEFHFRTEDERYELDIIVDSNRTIMEELEKTLTDIEAMSDAERRAFQLNDSLNCTSRATFLRVMTKIYTNSVPELVAAAKEKPIVGLKKIIEGLQEKDAAWTRFQQDANRAWRDALDKQMTTSLSLMNNQQKNYDQKAFKSKPLVSAIEQIFEDRKKSGADDKEAHMSLDFTPEGKVYQDVNDVTSHFFQDLGGKGDKDRTKVVLLSSRVLMEWLCREQDNAKLDSDAEEVFKSNRDSMEDDMDTRRTRSDRVSPLPTSSSQESSENAAEKFTKSLHRRERRVFYGDDNVYLVIRFYHMIQERFAKLLTSQANYTQEYDDNAKKQKKWQEGVGARSHGRLTLSEYVKTQQEAVDDIRNVRACPSAFYTTALRELKQLGSAQTDIGAFEDAIKNLFPGDAALFNNIDKLFSSLAKNIHHAACADDAENAVKLYLKFRRRLMDAKSKEERDSVEEEYLQAAEEVLRGRNKYRFEFVAESNAPHMNIWVMPREEKESEDDDEDEDGNEGGNEDKDDNKDKNEVEGEDDQDPTGNDEAEENDDDEEDNESDESPSGGEGSGGQAGDVEMED
ncbi:hypothetical protein B9Z55_002539 [Caenorhabditis nigoni]|uniref:Histone deacetylase interacting domain-containing protein n=1 Tax=Caenorhabditis nigoni TaxID=1611254 RepID=A0A2G5VL83_9PELO|nr:hypothetical protein B9Z55_002539 [Caenorhabditis nigoni]